MKKSLRVEPTLLMDCIREQGWESAEERDLAMKEIAEWLDEHAEWEVSGV